jgi:hypothetical protein
MKKVLRDDVPIASRWFLPGCTELPLRMKSRTRVALTVTIFAVVISAVGFVFDRVLIREGVARTGVLFISNLLTGVVASALFLQSKLRAEEKQRLLKDRVQKLAEMNHHVRNALQVVAFYRYQTQDPEAARLIQESIERIEWTLQEVLPRGWDMDEGLFPKRAMRDPVRRREKAASANVGKEDL